MKEDSKKWKGIPCSWIGKINIEKNDHTTPNNLQIQCNSYQITKDILYRTRSAYVKIFMETQKTQIDKAILKKKNENGGIKLPGFRQYYKAIDIKTTWYWY